MGRERNRFEWLTSHARQQWIQWRNRRVYELIIRPSDESAAYVEDGFFEVTMSLKNFYYDTLLVCDYVVPPERDFLRAFNGVLRYATPQIMAQTWLDSQWFSGWEQERREFNRALRVLPPGPYATLSGNGLDRNLVVRAVDRGGCGGTHCRPKHLPRGEQRLGRNSAAVAKKLDHCLARSRKTMIEGLPTGV